MIQYITLTYEKKTEEKFEKHDEGSKFKDDEMEKRMYEITFLKKL